MRSRRAQAGAVGALLLAVMVIIIAVLVAMQVLSRTSDALQDEANAVAGLQRAQSALETYASTAQRLPCPADPMLDTGLEVPAGVVCTFPEGTLPWQTIGLKRDDAYDPWARKLSYRVYTGGAGSLTQAGGVSMVICNRDGTGDATPTAGGLGGLCDPGANVYERNTRPGNRFDAGSFLGGKGLDLTDMAAPQVRDVAYVIISHGSTGLGGYTVSGARLNMPHAASKETKNINATGDFFILAHSDNDTEASNKDHFDDLLVYRRLDDLIRRIGLYARPWPKYGAGSSNVVFNAPTISAALAAAIATGDLGRTTIGFPSLNVTGEGGSTPANLSYDDTGAAAGLGVGGGGSNMIQSSANESLRIDFAEGWKRFGITLSDFGTYSGTFTEKMELRFYLDGVPVGTPFPFVKNACNPDGGLASFTVPVDAPFNRVDIVPLPAANSSGPAGITAFLVVELAACSSTSTACLTTTDAPANHCP